MKTDARVRYTKKVIQDSFLELLKEKPVAKITVKEVCEKADINRGTFYKHYQDCYDLLEKMEDEGLREFEKMLASIEAVGAQQVLEAILNTLQSYSQLIQALDKPLDERRFVRRLAGCCFHYMEQWHGPVEKSSYSVRRRDAGFAFLAGGSSNVIEWWLCGGMKEAPEEIAFLIRSLSESVIERLSG